VPVGDGYGGLPCGDRKYGAAREIPLGAGWSCAIWVTELWVSERPREWELGWGGGWGGGGCVWMTNMFDW